VPASFCGLYGIRPTHGRLDLTGMMAQAPTSDTTGWFARDAETFARVSAVLLEEPITPAGLPTTLVVANDAFGLADAETAAALRPMVRALSELVGYVREDLLAPPGLSVWSRTQRTLQSYEAWLTFRDWLDRDNPRLQFNVARGLVAASAIPESERQWAALMRAEARARVAWLVPPGAILCLPTTPFPAPRKGLPLTTLDPLRARMSCLTSPGGLTGVPQVSLPGTTVDGRPVGLSIVGAPGSDAALVAVAKAMEIDR
jgi:amidase